MPSGEYWKDFGEKLLNEKRYGEALHALKIYTEQRPDDPKGHNLKGLCLTRTRLFEEARDSFLKAIELDPDDARYYYNLGTTYMDLNENRLAANALSRAVTLNSRHESSWYNLACLYSQLGDRDRAADALEKWFALEPDEITDALEDPDLEPVKHHPRVQKVLDQIRRQQ